MRYVVLLAALALTGCADYQARMEAQRQANVAAVNASDDASCRNFGAVPGTESYTHCRLTISMQRANAQTAQDMQQQQIYSNMAITGAQILSAPTPAPPPLSAIQYPKPAGAR